MREYDSSSRRRSSNDNERTRFGPSYNPALNNMIFKGPMPPIDGERSIYEQVDQVCETHLDVLDLSDDDDRERYHDIYNVVSNGMGYVDHREFQWVPEEKTWYALVSWRSIHNKEKNKAKQEKLNMHTKGNRK